MSLSDRNWISSRRGNILSDLVIMKMSEQKIYQKMEIVLARNRSDRNWFFHEEQYINFPNDQLISFI